MVMVSTGAALFVTAAMLVIKAVHKRRGKRR
jgi:hypothetical protein